MNFTPSDYRLIARELSGMATAEEKADLQSWIAADPEHLRSWLLLRDAWALSGARTAESKYDAETDWPDVLSRLQDGRSSSRRAVPEERELHPRTTAAGGRMRSTLLRVAAVVGILLVPVLGWMLTRTGPMPSGASVAEITVPRGEFREIQLPDGSRATVGAETTLRFPTTFGGSSREVELEGMAYFDIAHDAERPFFVHAGGVTTRVVGTRFVVRAYPGEPEVEVAVSEGRVLLSGSTGPDTAAAVSVGQVGRVGTDGIPTVADIRSPVSHFGWTNGVIVIEDRSLEDALTELGRWYDAELRVEDPKLASRLITTTAGSVPLSNVVAGIVLALDARYEERGDTVVFVP